MVRKRRRRRKRRIWRSLQTADRLRRKRCRHFGEEEEEAIEEEEEEKWEEEEGGSLLGLVLGEAGRWVGKSFDI